MITRVRDALDTANTTPLCPTKTIKLELMPDRPPARPGQVPARELLPGLGRCTGEEVGHCLLAKRTLQAAASADGDLIPVGTA